ADLSTGSGGKREVTSIGMEEQQYPAELYTIYRAPAGRWRVTIEAPGTSSGGFLMVAPESTYGLYSYLTTTNLVAGQPLGLGAYLFSEPLPTEPAPPEKEDQETLPPMTLPNAPAPMRDIVVEGQITLQHPKGQQIVLPLLDDGKSNDGQARDGQAGAVLPALEPGLYRAHLRLRGTLPDGTIVERTGEQLFPVLQESLKLTGRASSWVIDDQRLGLRLEAESRAAIPAQALVYTEVWGTDARGTLIPVGWASSMVVPKGQSGTPIQLELEFDSRWLALAGTSAPLVLRNARVQDADTFVPLTTSAEIPLAGTALPKGALTAPQSIDANNPELRMGRPVKSQGAATPGSTAAGGNTLGRTQPAGLAQAQGLATNRSRTPGLSAPLRQSASEGILLVHGYCSGTLWPAGHFDDGPTVEFSDVNQNRSHNLFAQLIDQQGDAAFSSAYTIVAHSQGGAAALELYTRYWSGLDYSQAPRRIQTVGTPYWGTPLAGLIAWIGQLFDASCGANWNLTNAGSLLWQATIPPWARSQVHFATTAHGKWWIFESVCHASSLILWGIDDGVVSVSSGQLPGGNNLGMKRDWCHSDSMAYGEQYMDYSRNSEMDVYGRVSTHVGVIPATASCPGGQPLLTIHMDDEDSSNANGRGGWIGATTSTNNTTLRFCRVPGNGFRALSSSNIIQNHYAVLKLGTVCPNGSVEFSRYFDNEDHNNANSFAGPITPNTSNNNTRLVFCLFRSSSSTMTGFPNLGAAYGVFAASNFSQALATGYVYTDDEDSWNNNSYSAGSGWIVDAQRMVTAGNNTTLRMARVK
ncbi:MAG: hypothetical protein JOZ51_24280, partial [Chloroflexi bacterium]|nr:hypothetical protein [Chloroflexota bacterium]